MGENGLKLKVKIVKMEKGREIEIRELVQRKNSRSQGAMAQVYNPLTLEVEAGTSGVQSQHQLHNEFKDSLSYRRSCLSKEELNIIKVYYTHVQKCHNEICL